MNPKTKKVLLLCGLGLYVVVTVFLLTVSIIMIATMPDGAAVDIKELYKVDPNMITFLQAHPTFYLCACVIPLVLLLAGAVVLLIVYLRRAGNKKAELSDLSEEQKAALRAEILKDMDSSDGKKE